MFLHLSVIRSVHRGCVVKGGVWCKWNVVKGVWWKKMCGRHPWTQRYTPPQTQRQHPPRGRYPVPWSRGRHPSPDPETETATDAGGTHPTGMHSHTFYRNALSDLPWQRRSIFRVNWTWEGFSELIRHLIFLLTLSGSANKGSQFISCH